jgi:hypothetical protein
MTAQALQAGESANKSRGSAMFVKNTHSGRFLETFKAYFPYFEKKN